MAKRKTSKSKSRELKMLKYAFFFVLISMFFLAAGLMINGIGLLFNSSLAENIATIVIFIGGIIMALALSISLGVYVHNIS